MAKKIEGIVPVMITPYTKDNKVDYESLGRLVEWYIANGADVLFAVCQSSEMIFLSLEEKKEMAKFVVEKVNGRIPVVASGHTSDDFDSQMKELDVAVKSGADGIVLVSNHLDPHNRGTETFKGNLKLLLDRLPADLPLGVYECPAPYRRLISDDELKFMMDSGRFTFMKDVSCDLDIVKRRVNITKDSNMAILNANAAIAWDAMKAGSRGFNGVNTNFCPYLYKWLYTKWEKHPEVAKEVANFLVLAGCTESYGYPVLAKMYHQKIGNFKTILSRTITYDVYEKVWAIQPILENLMAGMEFYREKVKDLK